MLLDKTKILNCLPQREPFLMVDRVMECEPSKSITTELDLPETLPFFKGHFPNAPIMPGVLIVESMAQTAGLLIALTAKEKNSTEEFGEGKLFFLASNNVKFKSVVKAGNTLVVKAKLTREFGGLYSFDVEALNGRAVAASGNLVIADGRNTKL